MLTIDEEDFKDIAKETLFMTADKGKNEGKENSSLD